MFAQDHRLPRKLSQEGTLLSAACISIFTLVVKSKTPNNSKTKHSVRRKANARRHQRTYCTTLPIFITRFMCAIEINAHILAKLNN